MQMVRRPRRVLLSTVSSDSHTWNLVFLQLLLEESGYEVVNLGPCVPDELLLERARAERPDVVVISSVNGHGHLDGARVIRRLRNDPHTRNIPVMIGGKLGIHADGSVAAHLITAGFDAVFTDSTEPHALVTHLAQLSPAAGPSPRPVMTGDRRVAVPEAVA